MLGRQQLAYCRLLRCCAIVPASSALGIQGRYMATKRSKKPLVYETRSTSHADLMRSLWEAAVNLRGSIEPADYKRYVLPLIFLRFLSLRYERRRNSRVSTGPFRSRRLPNTVLPSPRGVTSGPTGATKKASRSKNACRSCWPR